MAAIKKSKDSVAWLGPADSYSAVTPSDATVVDCRALWIGTGGNVAVKASASASTVTFANVPDGTLLSIVAYHVMAATTATGIVALY